MKFTADTIGLSHEQSWFLNGSTQAQEFGYDEAEMVFWHAHDAYYDKSDEGLPSDARILALGGIQQTLDNAVEISHKEYKEDGSSVRVLIRPSCQVI